MEIIERELLSDFRIQWTCHDDLTEKYISIPTDITGNGSKRDED